MNNNQPLTSLVSSCITIPLEHNSSRLSKIDIPADLRILIVEDEHFYQCLLKSLMYKWCVRIAENGQVAIDILRRSNFDLILMDLEMPVLDGYRAARIIREELGIAVPIIAVSASTDPAAGEKVIEAGMNDFIAKPYYSVDLFRKIIKNLSVKKEFNY